MKILILILAFVTTTSLLSGCSAVQSPPSAPSVTTTETPAPAATTEPAGEEETGYDFTDAETLNAALAECYSYQIERADKCRMKVGNNEYYFDTSKTMLMDFATGDVEFPLYMKNKDNKTIFLGTIGYYFQVCEPYIYIESEQLWEDYPGKEMTRIVNLNDLSVTPFGRDVLIYVPDAQGDKVYYNFEIDDCIYVSDPSLKDEKKLHIVVPDKDIIEEKIELSIDMDEVSEAIHITDVKDGWIYFSYDVFAYEGPTFYQGNYRIKADGSETEKNGEGKFGDEIEY